MRALKNRIDKIDTRFAWRSRGMLVLGVLVMLLVLYNASTDRSPEIDSRREIESPWQSGPATDDAADIAPTVVRAETSMKVVRGGATDDGEVASPTATDGSLFGGVQGLNGLSVPLLTAAETYKYFENILVIMMLSPSRYHLAGNVLDHYQPFFKHIMFCGPRPATVRGIQVEGFNIVYGNEQYRAVAAIIRDYVVNKSAVFEGVLYIGDDVLLQPWSIASKGFNKNIPWATQMGIANLNNPRPVAAVPGMSIQGKYRSQWPYWSKNRKKLMGVLEEGGPAFREAMFKAAKATHPLIYKWSKYSAKSTSDEALHNVIFYTIVDTYYIPWRLAMPYADACDLMAKHWIFGECAIATMIRSLSPIYETMDIQFYWSTLSAADCHRYKWNVMADGFHRCRHDHRFSHLMYGSDGNRIALKTNRTALSEALSLNGLVPVDEPVKWLDGL